MLRLPFLPPFEKLDNHQQSVVNYMTNLKPYLDMYIENYPRILVGCLDDDPSKVARFSGITIARIDNNKRKRVIPVQYTRTEKGIRIVPIRGINFSRYKSIAIGSAKPEDLMEELSGMKHEFELEGVLYLSPSQDGIEILHTYINGDKTLSKKEPAASVKE